MGQRDTEGERVAGLVDARQRELTKPAGSLGRLESLVHELARIQCDPLPRARPAAALIFAADHPVAAEGVSAYPAEVTRAMLDNLSRGGAAASVLARTLDISLRVHDVGVGGAPCENAIVRRHPVAADVRGDLRKEDAMTEATFERVLSAGQQAVAELEEGLRVLLLGEIGIGNTTPAAALATALLGCDAAEQVGRGTGLDDEALGHKVAVVRDAVQRVAREGEVTPDAWLRRVGGPDLVALVGAMRAARERDLVVLIDGYTVSVAALLACRVDPALRDSLVFSHRSAESGHRAVLDALHAEPLLDLDMRLGEASGALTAFPILELACALHREMATFEEAGVPTALDSDSA